MGDQLAKGEEFERKAEETLSRWVIFGSKYEDAAHLFDRAANCFKLDRSWDKAGSSYLKLANCHLQLNSEQKAAKAYFDAASCFKITAKYDAISCLDQAVKMFGGIENIKMVAVCHKEIAELCESDQNIEQALGHYEKAADFFQIEGEWILANRCKEKVGQFAALKEQYQKATENYEGIARISITRNLPRDRVKEHLLNAGICQLCRGDVVAINNAIQRYQELDSTFSATQEYRLLADMASAIDVEDVTKFTSVEREFDRMTSLGPWRTILLLRVKEKLKAKELEEDDLT